jgi:hypothetical protein
MQHVYSFAKPFLGIACLILFLSTGAAFAQTTVGGINLFGDGSDGDVTITKFTVLTRDMYYHDLTIAANQRLDTGGFRVFVSGTLTLAKAARLSRDGNSDGTPLSAGTLGGSGRGGSYPDKADNVENSLGGSGGSFQETWGGGTAIPPVASVGGVGVFRSALQALSGRSLDGALVNGGAGGCGCGNTGGGGGSGGGVVVIAAHTIVLSGESATISANGGQKLGASGGGGVVVVISTKPQPVGLRLTALGGTNDYYPGHPGFTAWLN